MKRSKNYLTKLKIKKEKYSLEESFKAVKESSISKFNSNVELHLSTIIDKKNPNRIIRGSIIYKHKFGNEKKILLLTEQKDISEEIKKLYDYIGSEEYIEKIANGWSEFDLIIATPDIMPKLGSIGRMLGPKGLMPNPKTNTVTNNLKEVAESYRKGKYDFKSDATGNIHLVIGKVDNSDTELKDNFLEAIRSINTVLPKPITQIVKSIFLCPTMGPSIKLNNNEVTSVI
jgi:large subunit ribosomal protein L1